MDTLVLIYMTLLLLSLGSYVFLGLVLRGKIYPMPPPIEEWEPRVSIILAAKNEEAYLSECLSSLRDLDYPMEKLQIIVVNDASTDRSTDIINSFQNEMPNMRHLRLVEGAKEKPGKAGALLFGIEQSDGEILFFTDADCTAPPSWIRDILLGFRENIGIVGGFTLPIRQGHFFEDVQSLDWHYLLSIASAASQLNKPISWIGNNLAVRRSAYDQVGGYRNMSDSFVEDFILIKTIEKQTAWQCRFYVSPKSLIRTQPARTIRQLYAQRKRWALGISGARPFGWWIMVTGFLVHVLILISLVTWTLPGLFLLFLKSGIDILIFRQSSAMLHEPVKPRHIIVFEFFYIFSSIVLPILMLFDRRVTWKGAQLNLT